jgi:hypothetical protein
VEEEEEDEEKEEEEEEEVTKKVTRCMCAAPSRAGWQRVTRLRHHLPQYAKCVQSGEIPVSQGRNKGVGT